MEEEGKTKAELLHFIKSKLIDPDTTASATFLSELSKVSREHFFDRLAEYYDEMNYIEVRDTGHGMSIDELSDIFLRIGTSVKRKENLAGAKNLGDKGIGRLSAMRLGNRLHVKTSRNRDTHWNLLDIDWTLFSHDDESSAARPFHPRFIQSSAAGFGSYLPDFPAHAPGRTRISVR